jgi:GR25 family glycosyltransferase involved in LPS biosynthesis
MKSFGIDAVPIYGFRSHNCGISTDYYHNREKEKAKTKTIVAGLSHFSAWSAIKWMVEAKLTDHRTFLIVEDDVEFLDKSWKALANDNLQFVPNDWHVVYLGSCCADPIEDHGYIAANLYKLVRGMCTHAYLVNYEGACKLLETNQKVWGPIDIQMLVDSMPRMNFYGILPRLATQENTNLYP